MTRERAEHSMERVMDVACRELNGFGVVDFLRARVIAVVDFTALSPIAHAGASYQGTRM